MLGRFELACGAGRRGLKCEVGGVIAVSEGPPTLSAPEVSVVVGSGEGGSFACKAARAKGLTLLGSSKWRTLASQLVEKAKLRLAAQACKKWNL